MNHNDFGPYLAGDARGILAWSWLPDDLQRAEDATTAADHERAAGRLSHRFTRPATPTERHLLGVIGFADLPDDLVTHVSNPSGGLRMRRWPQLGDGVSVESPSWPRVNIFGSQ